MVESTSALGDVHLSSNHPEHKDAMMLDMETQPSPASQLSPCHTNHLTAPCDYGTHHGALWKGHILSDLHTNNEKVLPGVLGLLFSN